MIGDGCIDITSLALAVEDGGYRGDIELEILNENLWRGDQEATLRTAVARYEALPAPAAARLRSAAAAGSPARS
jgi:hypothetical protein